VAAASASLFAKIAKARRGAQIVRYRSIGFSRRVEMRRERRRNGVRIDREPLDRLRDARVDEARLLRFDGAVNGRRNQRVRERECEAGAARLASDSAFEQDSERIENRRFVPTAGVGHDVDFERRADRARHARDEQRRFRQACETRFDDGRKPARGHLERARFRPFS
jgi:hypothetical protein